MSYGMFTFLENSDVMEKLETTKMMFMRSMLGFGSCVGSTRLRIVINIPKMDYKLFVRLKRVLDKYKKHFGEEPKIHRDIVAKYFKELNESTPVKAEKINDDDLKKSVKRWSVVNLRRIEGIEIGPNFFDQKMKKIYTRYRRVPTS